MALQEQPLRVLLVEDNPADARLIQEELKDVPSARIEVLHVMRLADAKDRRTTFVSLTPKGAAQFQAMAKAHETWIGELLGGFSREDHALREIARIDEIKHAIKIDARTRQIMRQHRGRRREVVVARADRQGRYNGAVVRVHHNENLVGAA